MPGKEVEKREETVSWTCVWKQKMCALRDSRIWRILTILRMQIEAVEEFKQSASDPFEIEIQE